MDETHFLLYIFLFQEKKEMSCDFFLIYLKTNTNSFRKYSLEITLKIQVICLIKILAGDSQNF